MHGSAVLRRQLLRDAVMASRLAPGLSPREWRRFINGRVFFVVSGARAISLRNYDRYRDQVILAWDTASVMDAGVELHACRYNNGMTDRSPPDRRRLRSPADYVPVGRYADGRIAEVAAAAIPAGVRFTIWNGST